MFPVATRGAGPAPGEQSFAAIDAKAPICLKPQISLKNHRLLIRQFHDKIRVAQDQSPLMSRAQPGHLHRDALPTAGVKTRPRRTRHALQIEGCAEMCGLEGIARDVDCLRP